MISWTKKHFPLFYKTTDSGSLTRNNVFTAKTICENHIVLQLRYHRKDQTRKQNFVKTKKMFMNKSLFKKHKSMNYLKQ